MTTLSAIIIAKNEAKNIGRCLETISWADEIVVLDCGSTDDTLKICKQFTDTVYSTDWPGFGRQKNRALSKACCEWVLSIDADEWLSEDLQQEIKQTIKNNDQTKAYCLPRRSYYCGKMIQYGDWRKDKVLRLFPREKAIFSNDQVHERLITDNQIMTLKNILFHYSFHSTEEVLMKMNLYSSLSAQQKFKAGKRSSVGRAFIHGGWTFFKGYVLKRGFLDGRAGLLLALSNAGGSFYRYIKLIEMSDMGRENANKDISQ